MTSERTKAMDDLIAQDADLIAKLDPLVEALDSLGLEKADEWAPDIRKALAARGGRIVWGG